MILAVVTLAAGKGSRMKSDLPKVLHRLAGKPLLGHVLDAAESLDNATQHVVIGHGAELVRDMFSDRSLTWAVQTEQKGTGHAVAQALPDIADDALPATLVNEIMPTLAAVQADLPPGYLLEVGGTVEESARGQQSVNAGMPLFVLVVITLLMLQLRSMPLSLMVFVTAPLGLIGVTLFLLLFQKPFGFVAMLGTIALAGMIMRNAVILVDQIGQDMAQGLTAWDAIIESTVRRFRPIALTALTAVLAMIPLSRSVFFGPMAVAIMGGLIVATALTLLFLPALYAAWFRVKEEHAPQP